MLVVKYLRDGIRSGAITSSVRIWHRLHVAVGKRYRMEEGKIEVDSIIPITFDEITTDLARACGFGSVLDLLKVAKHGRGENVISSASTTFRHGLQSQARPRSETVGQPLHFEREAARKCLV